LVIEYCPPKYLADPPIFVAENLFGDCILVIDDFFKSRIYMSAIKSILFVCTGNTCRSVMAERLLKKRLKELGKDDVEVFSAGIRAPGGLPPTHGTIEAMEGEDVDVSDFRSKNLSDDMIRRADLILVMEEMHKEEIVKRVPQAASKTHLLKMFGKDETGWHAEGFDIPDPIGRPLTDYKYCINMIKREIDRIIKLV